jgi:hypothetical protein
MYGGNNFIYLFIYLFIYFIKLFGIKDLYWIKLLIFKF